MANIFISYRREDSAGYAGRLCDRLNATLGSDRVFMDVEDIQPGQDFTAAIDEKIAGCDIVLAVIGPQWLSSLQKRLGRGEDFVHEEISAALRRGITVVPVLVGGASMPAAGELPESLAPLHRRQAIEIRDADFDDGVKRMTKFLGVPLAPKRRYKWMAAAAAAVVVLAVILFFVRRPAPPHVRRPAPPDVQRPVLPDTRRPAAAEGRRPAPPDIEGVWIARMQKEGQRPYSIRLEFAVSGSSLNGIVEYPTGQGAIRDGRIEGRRLTFHTVHVPQFGSEPATIRFDGELLKDEIRLRLFSDSGITSGVAKRAAK
ncbi:MAG: toll/interleukin-1 receptor domain-containing protein [Bryobacteraceae bacterium]|nr:toll/interleukin-1 receptor domain-containing protein [Bryobacterales bacterium]MEB2361432.1 toll/interleukin-1 receptor domain-containing protein [Bryobacterales bacterium]NUN01458.1 toll/interleukin-1 receptor domain-containing protein [Bryobacteraceae bacterium]